jgi:hypothetical protein
MASESNSVASADSLRLDYEQTCQQIRTSTDTRFKLLAFVPTLTAAAVALLSGRDIDQWTVLAVGLLGFSVTLGIIVYEMRNTVLYKAAIDRAKSLEVTLHLPILTDGGERGGLFNTESDGPKRFLGFEVWHNLGLSLVYGAALGGWVYIIVNTSVTLLVPERFEDSVVIGLASIVVAGIVAFLVVRKW